MFEWYIFFCSTLEHLSTNTPDTLYPIGYCVGVRWGDIGVKYVGI